MKQCRECKIIKSANEFYKHSRMADGRLNKCIECVKASVGRYREANSDKIREYDRKRAMLPHRRVAMRSTVERYEKVNPLRRTANIIVGNAVRDKRLFKKPCEYCGSRKVHGHHDDYSQPLKVRWLYAPHHKAVHMGKLK